MGAAVQPRPVFDGAAGPHTDRETAYLASRRQHSSDSAERPVSEHAPFTQRRVRAQRTAKVATFGGFDLDYAVQKPSFCARKHVAESGGLALEEVPESARRAVSEENAAV